MAATATADEAYRIISAAVDQAFYKAAYPELDRPGFDPIRDYLDKGWREGRDPAPWFSVADYLRLNPDVAQSGDEPLRHYILHGAAERRPVARSAHARSAPRGRAPRWTYTPDPPPADAGALRSVTPCSPEDCAVIAAEFDADFYLANHADVAEAGEDPVRHYALYGAAEGRDPAPWFSTEEYLLDNPDVAAAGVNPFLHYLVAGRAEGRAPRSTLGFRHKIIATQTALETRVASAAARARRVLPTGGAFAAVAAQSRTGLRDVHITFSHDDFVENVGGVQLCLQYEAARIADRGRDHLHLCPETAWPVLRRGQPALLRVMLNGQRVGVFSGVAVAHGLAAARAEAPARGSFAIHNLLGHDVDEVLAILAAAGLEAGFFWLHDFTSLCAGYQLLRNDVQDCGAPPPESAACGICLYGPGRAPQVAEHERLFRRLRLTVVSPSRTALDFWRASWSYPAAAEVVHPHVRLAPRGRAPQAEPGPLRLAFLGQPSAHKGWPVFAEMAADFAEDPRYSFLHLGSRRDPRAAVEFHPVTVTHEEPRAMQDALERLQVDVAVIWSIFRETFCLAAYEALGAGCAIVTSPDSANVAALVEGSSPGRVLADERALAQALAQGQLLDLARNVRGAELYDLQLSGMTADLLEASVEA